MCEVIEFELISSTDSSDLIIDAINKRNPLYGFLFVCTEFQSILATSTLMKGFIVAQIKFFHLIVDLCEHIDEVHIRFEPTSKMV